MAYPKKIVLICASGYRMELDALVEQFIQDGVRLVAVVGKDCGKVEDIIDELVVGDGSDGNSYILTSSHPLKSTAGKRLALVLIASADGSIEGLRPGAMERLGLGPDDCLAVNPRLAARCHSAWKAARS